MKRILLIAKFLVLGTLACHAQNVAINTDGSQANASAMLDIKSNSKGLLIPRMTAAEKTAITSPANGLLIYQTDATPGFYYFNGNAWSAISSAAAAGIYTAGTGIDITGNLLSAKNTTAIWNANQLQGKDVSTTSPLNGQVLMYSVITNKWAPATPAAGAAGSGWSLTGNAAINPAVNFIGTTDAQPLIGKSNGQQVFRLSSTTENTLLGYQAGNADATGGDKNHFIGFKAGYNNTSFNNHFDGYQAGFKNTSGYSNEFIGFQSGYSNLTGTDNLFVGAQAGYSSITQSGSHFIGNGAGFSNTGGTENHFNGFKAGEANTTGSSNHFEGNHAGYHNTSGNNNHFTGYNAGYNNTTGINNFFEGYNAGLNNTTANNNYFSGNSAGKANTTGASNTFSGIAAGSSNSSGNFNVFNGSLTGSAHVSGDYNVAIGYAAGQNNLSGNGNVFIGSKAGFNETGSNKLVITNNSNFSPLIYGEFDNSILKVNGFQQVAAPYQYSGLPTLTVSGFGTESSILQFKSTGLASQWQIYHFTPSDELDFRHNLDAVDRLRILANGNLIVADHVIELSDKSLKTNIAPLKNSLQKLMKLGGYTYNWIDSTKSKEQQIGLIAQEVEVEFPQLVSTQREGIKGVAYSHMVPVLVESIKEQQAMIDNLKLENTQLKKDIAAIKAKLGLQ